MFNHVYMKISIKSKQIILLLMFNFFDNKSGYIIKILQLILHVGGNMVEVKKEKFE